MFTALGRFTHRRAKALLAAAGVLLVLGAVWGTGVFGALTSGGFQSADTESARAAARVEETFGRQAADVIVLYSSEKLTVDDPAYRTAVTGSLDTAAEGTPLARTVTYWTTRSAALVSDDERSTYAVLTLAEKDEDARTEAFPALRDALEKAAAGTGLDVRFGGQTAVSQELGDQVGSDIGRAEALSMPILLLLLLFVFGSAVAASMPLLVGVVAVLGSFAVLRAFSLATDVSVFSVNIVTMLGLGLAIDYSLFLISRFREELRAGRSVPDAVERTVSTAGRTVAFSGLVVGISLAGLMVFPQVFLRSMGMGGLAAVLMAVVTSLTVLPAVLSLLGHRIDSGRVRLGRRRDTPVPLRAGVTGTVAGAAQGGWYRLARSVMKRPGLYLVLTVAALVLLGLPFRNVVFGSVDERALPSTSTSREVSEVLDARFPANEAEAVVVSVRGADPAGLEGYVQRLGEVPGADSAAVGAARGADAEILVRHELDPNSTEARELVDDIRAVEAPGAADVLVGGRSAQLVDQLDDVATMLPWMFGFIGAVTLVALFLAFGSVLLPLKALLTNALSLTASFGAIVWIFQYGHLADWLGFTATGTVDANQPVLIFAIAFGLSMDYEVFLLSRVREEWDRTHDNTESVATGLQRTGSIITSAALLLIVVVAAFATSGITFIKMIGVGLTIAIAVDALVVRSLLVPAAMRLFGAANWWAPAPLARFWQRYGHREEPPAATPGARGPADGAVPRETAGRN
ncbi:MMPL family transporter [Streptomyces sp. NPDC002262]|uniref:MMPL family transporter n=1 Tax=Streptomyces sp. NPDC002262 TaxID=3154414 RepID=UPI00331BA3AC